ncbi:rhomboid family intramembrane serine protease [Mesonia sp.]|uniref:rhomboid family intramembrane serine protease n=1 Tax=Mesonia sp. TaxID=1960830 RepID=UPI001750A005|nr:rhomboid family intramembrane serine protease [Mesonia sp.]HIB37339.1 rhomboid family intramembrane serine protease [Mesonia sp.]HIO27455.1 rhomboid family intramembrane serine protease [Flavobacteriaceae bacterium]
MGDLEIVTFIVIGINAVISLKGFNDTYFFDKYKFNVGAIKMGEQLRVITSGFLHVDVTHLFVNMFTLYFFSGTVINHVGVVNFFVIYLGSLILGNLFSLYFHKDEDLYTAVGASGAVMGVLYSAILLEPSMTLGVLFIIPVPAYLFGIGYLLYTIYGMKNRVGNIGHDAHFGGAMGGYFITLLFEPWVLSEHLLMVILLFIPILILFILQKTGNL